jgi:hypothetical protein
MHHDKHPMHYGKKSNFSMHHGKKSNFSMHHGKHVMRMECGKNKFSLQKKK